MILVVWWDKIHQLRSPNHGNSAWSPGLKVEFLMGYNGLHVKFHDQLKGAFRE